MLADTHLRAGLDRLPVEVVDVLRCSDVILHAGDLVTRPVLDALRALGEVHAVLGNNDHELAGVLPEELHLELGGVRIGMVHDSGLRKGRATRMARRFPGADLVVFGHSHVPVNEAGVGAQFLFNPGSPTQRRAQPHRTFGRLRLEHGAVVERAILAVPERTAPRT